MFFPTLKTAVEVWPYRVWQGMSAFIDMRTVGPRILRLGLGILSSIRVSGSPVRLHTNGAAPTGGAESETSRMRLHSAATAGSATRYGKRSTSLTSKMRVVFHASSRNFFLFGFPVKNGESQRLRQPPSLGGSDDLERDVMEK